MQLSHCPLSAGGLLVSSKPSQGLPELQVIVITISNCVRKLLQFLYSHKFSIQDALLQTPYLFLVLNLTSSSSSFWHDIFVQLLIFLQKYFLKWSDILYSFPIFLQFFRPLSHHCLIFSFSRLKTPQLVQLFLIQKLSHRTVSPCYWFLYF